MALKKTPAAPAAAAPAFEDDNDTVVASAPNPTAVADAAEKASTAIAVAKSAGLPALGGKFQNLYKPLKDALPALGFGTLPRFTGSQGKISAKDSGKKEDLGESIDISLLSYHDEFVISPGEDSDEATKAVRYSLDGVTIEGTGESVETYLEKLRTVDGYENASVKRYVQLIGILERSDKKSSYLGNMVQVSLSPQAAKAFDAFMLQESVKASRGTGSVEGADRLTITAESRSNGKNDFTLLITSRTAAA